MIILLEIVLLEINNNEMEEFNQYILSAQLRAVHGKNVSQARLFLVHCDHSVSELMKMSSNKAKKSTCTRIDDPDIIKKKGGLELFFLGGGEDLRNNFTMA